MKQEVKDLIYKNLCLVPKGFITTYKDLMLVSNLNSPRLVGTAMKENKHLITIPCHRVVLSSGLVGMYQNGRKEKIKLLIAEGLEIEDNKILNFSKKRFKF